MKFIGISPDFTNYMQIFNAALNGIRPEFKYPIPDCYQDLITNCILEYTDKLHKKDKFSMILNIQFQIVV